MRRITNKVPFVLLLSMVCVLFAGCDSEPKTLIDTASLKVACEGAETIVYDLASGEQYRAFYNRSCKAF